MSQVCSIFSQLLKLFPRAEFEQAVRQHRGERHARGFTCWGQFVAMLFCQLGRAQSLSQGKLRHLGLSAAPPRSTLAYANRQRPWQVPLVTQLMLFDWAQPLASVTTALVFEQRLPKAVTPADRTKIALNKIYTVAGRAEILAGNLVHGGREIERQIAGHRASVQDSFRQAPRSRAEFEDTDRTMESSIQRLSECIKKLLAPRPLSRCLLCPDPCLLRIMKINRTGNIIHIPTPVAAPPRIASRRSATPTLILYSSPILQLLHFGVESQALMSSLARCEAAADQRRPEGDTFPASAVRGP